MSHVMNGETNGGGGGGGIESDMVDSRELMMLNNKDFFADDIYDFKETFMRHDAASNGATNGGAQKRSSSKLKNGNEGKKPATRKTNGIVYDVYDGGEEEEDEYDEYGNDQAAGVIYEDDDDDDEAVRIGVNRHATAYDEEEDDEEDFRVKPSFPEQPAHSDFHNFVDDMDIGMGETFFKRVDSMELVKPKKTKIISNYLVGELLGDGSYGKVKECLDMNTLARRAVKIINLKMVQRKIPHGVENVRKEIRIMGKLEHKNVIKLYGTFEKGSLNNCPKTPLVPRTNHVNENNNNPHPEDDLLRHTAHIVNSIEKPPKLYIFMDYCITSLEKLLKSAPDSRLRNYQACFYFKQLIDGLEYLHSLNIIHNDIKPGNLLLTCDDVLKICDFSISADLGHFAIDDYLTAVSNHNANSQNNMEELAKMDSSNANSQINIQGGGNGNSNGINPNLLCGSSIHHTAKFPISQCTPMFQCPEMLDEDMDEAAILREATKIDIWSSGVTLYQLTTGDLPFKGATIHQIFECIRNSANTITIPAFIDHNLEQLLNGMLNRDPVKRLNLSEIRESDWFKRKHPMIREEMAPLPVDALENETSTYRMLNYLEKYCRPESSAAQGVNHQQHNVELNNGGDLMDATASNEDAVISQQPSFQHQSTSAAAPAAAATNQAQSIVQPTQDNKKFAQAAKAKRNHCEIM